MGSDQRGSQHVGYSLQAAMLASCDRTPSTGAAVDRLTLLQGGIFCRHVTIWITACSGAGSWLYGRHGRRSITLLAANRLPSTADALSAHYMLAFVSNERHSERTARHTCWVVIVRHSTKRAECGQVDVALPVSSVIEHHCRQAVGADGVDGGTGWDGVQMAGQGHLPAQGASQPAE